MKTEYRSNLIQMIHTAYPAYGIIIPSLDEKKQKTEAEIRRDAIVLKVLRRLYPWYKVLSIILTIIIPIITLMLGGSIIYLLDYATWDIYGSTSEFRAFETGVLYAELIIITLCSTIAVYIWFFDRIPENPEQISFKHKGRKY